MGARKPYTRPGGPRARRGGLALAFLLTAWLIPAQAQADQHIFLEAFGSASQPSFTLPSALGFERSSEDLYVLSGGDESQTVTVSATAGQFRLSFQGDTTADLAFNAPRRGASSVQAALEALPSIGAGNVFVSGGPASDSSPYKVGFEGSLSNTDLPQLECVPGTVVLSGGSGCAVATGRDGEPRQMTRWHPDGTPAPFSALGENAIDGAGGEDQTPEGNLAGTGVAIAGSTGAAAGDVFVSRGTLKAVDAFANTGAYLGRLSAYRQGPNAEGPEVSFAAGNQPNVCGVAVDGAGDLYVGQTTVSGSKAVFTIHKYHPTTNPPNAADNVANFSVAEMSTTACFLTAGSGPSGGYLFAAGQEPLGSRPVFKLDSTSGSKQYVVPESEGVSAVGVDPETGYLYAAKGSEVLAYDASGSSEATLLESIPIPSKVTGIAVDGSNAHLYVARGGSPQIDVYGPVVLPQVMTEAATQVQKTAATLNGTVDPEEVPLTECLFEYGETESYGQTAPCEVLDGNPISGPGEIPADSEPHTLSADLSGLEPNTTYHYRLKAANATAADLGEDRAFKTLGPPLIEAEAASQITATEAKISAEVDPRGEESEVAVEYVSEAEFLQSAYAEASVSPSTQIGAGIGFADFSQELTGLTPDTTYHFRILAQNQADPPVHGQDHAFTTFVLPTGLPDNRAYEQVSPARKLGEVFPPEPGPRLGLGGTCTGCMPGWSKPRAPMQASPDGEAVAYEGGPFSTGLAAGINSYVARRSSGGWQTTALSGPQLQDTEGQGFKAFSADLSRAVLLQAEPSLTPDAPTNFANLYLTETGKAGLTPLITEVPPNRSPGAEGSDANRLILTYAGANAGTEATEPMSHVIFQANDALSGEAPGIAPEAPAVEPGETNLYEWSGGELRLVNVLPGNATAAPDAVIGSGVLMHIENENFDFDHAISDDGSRIFWSTLPDGQLYVRENAESTIQIPDPGKFLVATPDGSRVLLSDGKLYGLEDESLADLTGGQGGFEGMAGASEDLSRVYFVADEALTPPGEENANGEHAEAGEHNLYLSDEGSLTFIAILLDSDNNDEALGPWRAAPGNRLAQASADGRFLAFESRAPLTGYDSRASHGEGCVGAVHQSLPECFEVFSYDAVKDTLLCASCNPIGRRPLGQSNLAQIFSQGESFPQPSNLPDEGEGRLFFESQDTLSAADSNGHIQDVYEWQPQGVGGCTRPTGCITLISSGHSPQDSHFVDATPSGNDVFFTTRDALVPQDIDGDFMDLYDARVEGGIPQVLHPPCQGQACRGAGSAAPAQSTPASSTFAGPGNQRPKSCAKPKVKRRGKCVKRQKQRHRRRAAKHKRGGRR